MVVFWVLLTVAAVASLLVSWGGVRWRSSTRELLDRLAAAQRPVTPTAYDPLELEGLPAPVQRYLRAVLQPRQAMAAAVHVEHTGTFDMGRQRPNWRAFTSTQRISARPPGFVWDARIRLLPGLGVSVHDAYVAGQGVLRAAVLGLWPVADQRGGVDLAVGELMRYLAEAVWHPTALLPSQGVRWRGVDERSARATLADGDVEVSLLFHFDDHGLVDTVSAEARGRLVGAESVPTPWQGRFWNFAQRSGMRVPLDGEVAWLLPEGPRPYWRGHITDLAHGFER
ncbi:MAG TPA: DUF6544 family protein [Planctomycetota bacterium]|nr:DUF6544 family protein [Planctomycetota bacterium]